MKKFLLGFVKHYSIKTLLPFCHMMVDEFKFYTDHSKTCLYIDCLIYLLSCCAIHPCFSWSMPDGYIVGKELRVTLFFVLLHSSRVVRKPDFCLCENKVTAQLISAFVTARIVQSFIFINLKFQASSLLL